MEIVRVEIREIADGEIPPIIMPRVGGHRRVYTEKYNDVWHLINIMAIGGSSDGMTYGIIDLAMFEQTPEKYFYPLTMKFLKEGCRRLREEMTILVAFLCVVDPAGPQLIRIIERDFVSL